MKKSALFVLTTWNKIPILRKFLQKINCSASICHQDTCVCVRILIYKHNYRYQVLTKKIKTPLKQLSFPSISSPMEMFWRLSTMKENPYESWFIRVLFPFLLFHLPWFCVVSIGKFRFKTQLMWEILQHISSDVFVVCEKYLQITYLVPVIGKWMLVW